MKRPLEALKNIDLGQYHEKQRELEEKKHSILSNMNNKQKEI